MPGIGHTVVGCGLGGVQVVDFADLPCTAAVCTAFEDHPLLGQSDALLALLDWTDLCDTAIAGISGETGVVPGSYRTVAWMAMKEYVIITVTDPLRERFIQPLAFRLIYSLEWRTYQRADGRHGAYVHAFWIGGADMRPAASIDGAGDASL
jgi:hypothetical protein